MKIVIDIPEEDYKFIKDLQSLIIGGRGNGRTIQKNVINALRNGTPYEERPKGKWIYDGIYHDNDNPIDNDMYRCSVCKRSIITALTNPTELFPYCHCGAMMEKEGTNGD